MSVKTLMSEYLGLIVFVLGLLWKQIVTHFDVQELKKNTVQLSGEMADLQEEINQVKADLHEAIREQGRLTNENIKSLTEVTTRLAISTEVMAVELKNLKEKK